MTQRTRYTQWTQWPSPRTLGTQWTQRGLPRTWGVDVPLRLFLQAPPQPVFCPRYCSLPSACLRPRVSTPGHTRTWFHTRRSTSQTAEDTVDTVDAVPTPGHTRSQCSEAISPSCLQSQPPVPPPSSTQHQPPPFRKDLLAGGALLPRLCSAVSKALLAGGLLLPRSCNRLLLPRSGSSFLAFSTCAITSTSQTAKDTVHTVHTVDTVAIAKDTGDAVDTERSAEDLGHGRAAPPLPPGSTSAGVLPKVLLPSLRLFEATRFYTRPHKKMVLHQEVHVPDC